MTNSQKPTSQMGIDRYSPLLEHQTASVWHVLQCITRNMFLFASPRCPSIWKALLLGRAWPFVGPVPHTAQIIGIAFHSPSCPDVFQWDHPSFTSTDHHMTEANWFIGFDLENTYGQKTTMNSTVL